MTRRISKSTNLQISKSGFTLIELLVVIFITGILIGLSVFGLQNARQDARDAQRKADLQTIRAALEMFKADCGKYYYSATSLPSPFVGIVDATRYTSTCVAASTYLSKTPADVISTQSYKYYSADGSSYVLCASLERSGGTAAACGTWAANSCGGSGCNYQVTSP
jgi:general secretion pathway protein G